jgi:hypothetical protein
MDRKIITSLDEFAKELAKLRKETKTSRQSLSKESGCSDRTIARLEKLEATDIGFRKALNMLDSLGYGIQIVPKNRILTLQELQNGAKY